MLAQVYINAERAREFFIFFNLFIGMREMLYLVVTTRSIVFKSHYQTMIVLTFVPKKQKTMLTWKFLCIQPGQCFILSITLSFSLSMVVIKEDKKNMGG